MRSRWTIWASLLSLTVAVAGCGGDGGQPKAGAEQKPENAAALRPPLSELIKRSRGELAKRGDDLLTEIRKREEARRKDKVSYQLLPKWYRPIVVPVFQESKFHPELGLSLPLYVDLKNKEEQSKIAWLFAQGGDLEAAKQLVTGPVPKEWAADQGDKNIPFEWTRMVALELNQLQQRIALGEADALEHFLAYHKEVEQLLDEKLKAGFLGSALLPRGRKTLEDAVAAWRALGKEELAAQAEEALALWHKGLTKLPLNEGQASWVALLGGKANGRVISCNPGRALDALQLPLPADAADAFFVFFDDKDRLEEILIAYNPQLQVFFPQPLDLVSHLANWNPPTEANHRSCSARWGTLTFDATYSPFESAISGWVRMHLQRKTAEPQLPRDFGAVHLDWTYEHNRLHSAPNVMGNPLALRAEMGTLTRVENPLPAGRLNELTLRSVSGHPQLVQEGHYIYKTEVPWHELLEPVFARLGPGRWSDERTQSGVDGHVKITWEDRLTQIIATVPHQQRDAVSVTHRDRREASAAVEREKAVTAREEMERRQRLDEGKALVRLPRKLDAFPLGISRDEMLKYVPRGQFAYRTDFPDGFFVVSTAPVPTKEFTPYLLKQVTARFNAAKRLNWVRTRYETGSKPPIGKKDLADWPASLLQFWRQQAGSVAATTPPRAAHLTDSPQQPVTHYRWEDDLSIVTYSQDPHGVEITLEDRPAIGETAVTARMQFLPPGPAKPFSNLKLGGAKAEFRKELEKEPTTNEDGAWVVALAKGTYDVLLCWFDDKDRITKIAARYRQAEGPKSTHKDMEKLLNDQWGAELKSVGWPVRRDVSNQGAMQGYVWFDDASRFRVYWADSDNTPPRLWSEWLRLSE